MQKVRRKLWFIRLGLQQAAKDWSMIKYAAAEFANSPNQWEASTGSIV
jgi:hypothetical protein